MSSDEGYLVLEHGSTRLTLDPRRGGTIRDFTWRGQNVLRPTPADSGDDPFETACFPMVPFANRIAQGRFSFDGREVQLEPNWSEDPHPLHGHGWRASWAVAARTASSARVSFEALEDQWPWRFRCEQFFKVMPEGLAVALSVDNLSRTPMPVMLGLHPYFQDAAHAQLQAELPRVWLTDDAALPVREMPTPAEWRFEPRRAIGAVPLDHSFSGWNGFASLRWPNRTVTLRATHCSHLHVYAPARKDLFCVEPQTAAAGALGRNGGEATVVAPGERFGIRVNFMVGAS
ncbi:MAG: aldose 1-epimerase [Steroidobacteraceae bacterium]